MRIRVLAPLVVAVVCAATGAPICWGDDSAGQASVPPGFG